MGRGKQSVGAGALLALWLCAACGASRAPSTDLSVARTPSTWVQLPPTAPAGFPLTTGWTMQSSQAVSGDGTTLSLPGYGVSDWYPVTVPSTVLAGLVAAGVYPDIYHSQNLSTVDASQFAQSWWYRTEFSLPAEFTGQTVILHLDGVNYRANVWCNGILVAPESQIVGTYRVHSLDLTACLQPSGLNALALEVFPPDPQQDLAISWVDWAPAPPDNNMGLYRDVYLSHSGAVTVSAPQVRSVVEPNAAGARLTVFVDVTNHSAEPVTASVTGSIESASFQQDVTLGPQETQRVTFDPGKYPSLVLPHPRLWWPAQMGAAELYKVDLTATVQGTLSSQSTSTFGVRTVTSELTDAGYLLFRVNGQRILLRGGGWAPDLLLRASRERLAAELSYVKNLGLNTIRLEGHLESDLFFQLCDQEGILVLPGWQCCDAWQNWDQWTPEISAVAAASMTDQALRLANHPSVIDFLIGSDQAPPPEVEALFVKALQDSSWPNPISASASDRQTPLLGKTGFKMTGPYDWTAPAFWYLDTQGGGAFGFNTETSTGPSIPALETLRSVLSPDELDALWSAPDVPQFHAGAPPTYDSLAPFNLALSARYGAPTSLEDYARKADLMSYEGKRAQFEAFGRNKYANATGVIHWMLNNPWPSLIWSLYDYNLVPAGSFYGAKKANERIHIQYSYDDQSIAVVNDSPSAYSGLVAKAQVLNLDASTVATISTTLDLAADSVQRPFNLPGGLAVSTTYFLKLTLAGASGAVVSENFYWLSSTPETLDWQSDQWYGIPDATAADYTSLSQLPATALGASAVRTTSGPDEQVTVTLTNPGPQVALFVGLRLTRGPGGPSVTPVLWEDNDISLLPGESRVLNGSYHVADLQGLAPTVEVAGWNVPATVLPL